MAALSTSSTEDGLTPYQTIDQITKLPKPKEPEARSYPKGWDPADLLKLYKKSKREAFDQRWVFERQWLRNIHYMNNRQWIYYNSKAGEWQDKRLAKWIPRPVTNKCKETVQAIRAMFTSIRLGVNVRPNGQDPKHVTAAATADQMSPILHEEHQMNKVMEEFDWWLLVTGNAFLYTYQDYDIKYGQLEVRYQTCANCGHDFPENEIADNNQLCPECGQPGPFTPTIDETTLEPKVEKRSKGQGVTRALSPLELAFPNTYPRFDDVPFVILMRWRTRSYYENNPALWKQVEKIKWQKSPQERSMQIFKSLPNQNDLGVSPFVWSGGTSGTQEEEGIPEYELHYKPCGTYPEGLVIRVVGETDELILEHEEEALPGPFPYKDADGQPLFTFTHGTYEHVGGRILGSGCLDNIIQKQDQLNQLDSMIQMIIQRMANPVWLEPKGAEVEKFTGEPGLVVKWNPLTVQGNAKPERIPGEGPNGSFFTIREMYLKDIEELAGTYDIVKGAKPTGVEAFSALQLLVERSQSRFSNAFQSRGDAYRHWFKCAIELEREFGPDERTRALLSPAGTYTFKTFKNASLHGSFNVIVEDGSNTPKTTLGMRASVEHLNQLGLIDRADPDQRYKIYQLFGQTQLSPSLDIHVQAALQKQQAFEEWLTDKKAQMASFQTMQTKINEYQQTIASIPAPPTMPNQVAVSGDNISSTPVPQEPLPQLPPPPSPTFGTPLAWKPWYDPTIHRQEFMKWANSDRMRELLTATPAAEELLVAHLAEIDQAFMMEQIRLAGPQALQAPQPTPSQGQPGGGGAAMNNSNRESGSTSNAAGGNGVPKAA